MDRDTKKIENHCSKVIKRTRCAKTPGSPIS